MLWGKNEKQGVLNTLITFYPRINKFLSPPPIHHLKKGVMIFFRKLYIPAFCVNFFCLVGENEPLYFADVCAGPGGFSEYVLWRKKWRAKGYGFTLKDTKHDFKLEDFYAGSFSTYIY